MKTRLLIAALALLPCISCVNSTSLQTFTQHGNVRLEIDGVEVFTYDDAFCQLSFNEQRKEFRAMTDTMLDYFCITLSEIPSAAGDRAQATVVWSTPDGERSRNGITLEAKRIEGDVIWLCDSRLHTAAVVRVLE